MQSRATLEEGTGVNISLGRIPQGGQKQIRLSGDILAKVQGHLFVWYRLVEIVNVNLQCTRNLQQGHNADVSIGVVPDATHSVVLYFGMVREPCAG